MSAKITRMQSTVMPIVILFVSIGVMLALHATADRVIKVHERDKNDVFLPSYESVRLCSLGFDRFLSDMYWLAFVQYCGNLDTRRGESHRMAYTYMDLITQLDPYFARPYWYGCWSIGYWQKRPDLADKILQRGIRYNPTAWDLPYLAGVNAYIFGSDAKKAAAYYRQAARLKGAPDYLERQAMILESPAPAYYKRIHTLSNLTAITKDENAKAAYRAELIATLVNLYDTAPTQRIRDVAKSEIAALDQETFAKLKQYPPIVTPMGDGPANPIDPKASANPSGANAK